VKRFGRAGLRAPSLRSIVGANQQAVNEHADEKAAVSALFADNLDARPLITLKHAGASAT
jgi:hypothetical protein